MSDETNTQNITAPARRPSKRMVAIVAAGALVLAGGIAAIGVSAANAEAARIAEINGRCEAQLREIDAQVREPVAQILASTEEATLRIQSTKLPGAEGWDSAPYNERQAVEAADGVEARASGAEHVKALVDARQAVIDMEPSSDCASLEDAEALGEQLDRDLQLVAALKVADAALSADFEAFQAEERERITAEVEAARIAAEEEAARVAAEQEAARVAAEAEAARKAAAQRHSTGSGSGSAGGGSSSGGGTSSPPQLGGGIGLGPSDPGQCWTDNGMGGTKAC